MTRVVFFRGGLQPKGFYMTGHCTSGPQDDTGRLCCAAVSSAAYMAANTITEIEHVSADISVNEGEMRFILTGQCTEGCRAVLEGFELHITELAKQYDGHLTIKTEAI